MEGANYTVRVHGSGNAVIEVARQALSRSFSEPLQAAENKAAGKMIAHDYDAHWYSYAAEGDGLSLLTCVSEDPGLNLNAMLFDENGTLISAFERYAVAASLSDEEREAYMRILLSEIVLLLSVSRGDKISADDGELGAKVIRYLNDNITANITLDKLAKRFFVSKYYLCRAFKKHNGISIHGYVNQKRVMYAKQLMEEGETASGAAYRVGFGDYSAFYRAYIKVIGTSPVAEQNRKERQ
jgi:AraC-like DNA-binding protein